MGWLKRHWQADEEVIARMQSRYAADDDQNLTHDKKSDGKGNEDDASKKDGGK